MRATHAIEPIPIIKKDAQSEFRALIPRVKAVVTRETYPLTFSLMEHILEKSAVKKVMANNAAEIKAGDK
jgi:hypothetical protein